MVMMKTPSALPAFSFNWIGGDIRGLSNLAGALYAFASRSEEPGSVLKNTVERLVGESGDYKGEASGRFKLSFDRDITDVNWLSVRANTVGGIVDGLAVRLAKIESWLESKAEQGVRAEYITIDGVGKLGLPSGTSNPRVQNFLQQFNQYREQALMAAKSARKAAASNLASEYRALAVGLKNYRDQHKETLSDNELRSLNSSLAGLDSSFAEASDRLKSPRPPDAHQKSVMKDLVEGAIIANSTIMGGVVGSVVPGAGTVAGAGVGGLIGAAVAPLVGSVFD